MIVVNAKFSFVRMTAPAATPLPDDTGCMYALPMAVNSDLQFQFIMQAETPEEYAQLKVAHTVQIEVNGAWHVSGEWSIFDMGNNQVLFYLPTTLTYFATIPVGTCFRIGLQTVNPGDIYYSNCFVKIAGTNGTASFTYKSDENQNGFIYCGWPSMNKIRLYAHLYNMQFEDQDSEIYRYSSGEIKIVNARSYKTYSLLVDTVPGEVHQNIMAMLLSDSITMLDVLYNGSIAKNGAYTISYVENLNYLKDKGQGEVTVYCTPYTLVNDNCGNCP